MAWYAYLLHCSDGTLYAGSTSDLIRREEEHNNSPKGAAYTRARRPVKMVYSMEFPNRSEAAQHEAYLKTLSRTEKLALIKL